MKDPPLIVEAGAGRGGEDVGGSNPLLSLPGEAGGDNPVTWSRLGKFA